MASPSTPSTVLFIQAQPFVLSGSGSSIGDTTLVLQSFTGIDGTNIVTADLGSFAYGTIEPGNGSQEEAILFTGVTQNANGTATLTGISSLGFKTPYTLTTGMQKTHAGASKFILSNDAAFYNNIILYLNSIAGAGAANASTTVKGIVQAATTAQVNSATPTGSTGAVLVVTPDVLVNSTNNQYVSSIINTGIPYAVATGTASAFTATLASSITSLASGTSLNFLVPTTNASGTTLNVNSLGAKPIKKAINVTLASGDLLPGEITSVVYDGTNFQITSPIPSTLTLVSSGATTHDISVTGAQTIVHGLGITPKLVTVKGLYNTQPSGTSSISYGVADAVYSGGAANYSNSNASWTTSAGTYSGTAANTFFLGSGTTASGETATLSVDATNITLTWSKSGSPTGLIYLTWTATA